MKAPTDHFLLVEELEHSLASAKPALLSLRLILRGRLRLRLLAIILVIIDPGLSRIVAHGCKPILLMGRLQAINGRVHVALAGAIMVFGILEVRLIDARIHRHKSHVLP